MKVALIPNLSKNGAYECTCEVISFLTSKGCMCLIDERLTIFKDNKVELSPIDDIINNCDVAIAIGGDGTIIQCAKYLIKANKPIVGINAGRLGFLAELERDEVNKLDRIINGDYIVRERMVIEMVVSRENRVHKYYALNDIVISKNDLGKMIDTDILCNGKLVDSYRSDGIIFSTPTGSTAYSMSAGGPVVDPIMSCIIMTPISPHSLMNRTLIFDEEKEIGVKLKANNSLCGASIFIDGEERIELEDDDIISIRKAAVKAKLIHFGERDFYEVLSYKVKNRI